MQLVLISGLSGSGKSIALRMLEDAGYYCVDNLPVDLLVETALLIQTSGQLRMAISVDVRNGARLESLPDALATLRRQGIDARLLFLDASTTTLVKRFSETRRPHPLASPERTLPECIELEREMLAGLTDLGHRMDTSELSPVTLRGWIRDFVALDESRITLLFQSFGFKHGIPLDADFVFDARALPNPYYDPALRPFNGRDLCIIEFLEGQPQVRRMQEDIRRFIAAWLPDFIRANRAYLTIAIGCTGGQHRSVYLTETIARHFAGAHQTLVRHRELAT